MKKNTLNNPEAWIPKELFAAYCGKKSAGLLSFYDKAVESKKMNRMSLNWLAILILPAWLGYRRQWALLATFVLIFAVLPFGEAIIGKTIPSSAFLGTLLVMGLMANGLLLMTANGLYEKMNKEGLDAEKIRKSIEGKAEPSVSLAVLSTIGIVGITTISTLLATPLSADRPNPQVLEIDGKTIELQTELSDEELKELLEDPELKKWMTE